VLAFGLFFLGLARLLAAPGLALPLLAGAFAAGALLVRRQLSQPSPLLPVDLLRIRVVALSVAASVCGFAAWYASYVALPFLLQAAGRSQVETGLLMTPWPLAIGIIAPVAGRLSDRLPTAILCAGGMVAMAAGLALLAVLPPGGPAGLIGGVVFLCGLGFGLFQTPNNRTMLLGAPKARSGGAGGMQATARLLGTTLGTTVLGLAFGLAGTEEGPRLGLGAAMLFALLAAGLSLSRRRAG
jgi:MFS transporter, DHA2 family, multidrug resistance protein